MKCKITFLGGGSLRTLGVIRDWILQGDTAEGSSISIMDLDSRRMNIITNLAKEMPEIQGRDITVTGTTELEPALDGADFVYNVIRVGGVEAMTQDKRIGLKYGFHGHDDFGPSAAMITLRTVPVVLKITEEMTKRCPDAWFLNFTNPVPFIVRAVNGYSQIKTMGLCGGDQNQLYDIPTTLGWDEVPCNDLWYRGVGIDHFSWSTELKYKGKDFYPELFEAVRKLDRKKLAYYCRMSIDVLELYGQWLSSSAHCFHWTHHDELRAQLQAGFDEEDKGERLSRNDNQNQAMDLAEKCLEKELGDKFWEEECLKNVPSPENRPVLGMKVIDSMLNDRGDEMMVNMHAPGKVDNLQDDGIVLISAKIFRNGPEAFKFEGVPEGIAPLTRQILAYQKALVDAAVQGSRLDLEKAIFMDPMMRDTNKVRTMLDELLKANEKYLRQELLK